MANFNGIVYSISKTNTEFYKRCLRKLDCDLITTCSYLDFEKCIEDHFFDLIIIDLNLDEIDGISLVQYIRNNKSKESIIFICSKKADDFIIINSLDSGADNFISLPINSNIFKLKIFATLKRIDKAKVKSAGIFIDKEKFKVTIHNKDYIIQKRGFHILTLLNSVPGKYFSREEIASKIWNDEKILKGRVIEVHMSKIRKILGHDVIITNHLVGYALNLK